MIRWAAPRTAARRRRWWERPAERAEVAWLPRYRVLVPTEGGDFWEVWLCGLQGTLSERPQPGDGAPAVRALDSGPESDDQAPLCPPWRLDRESAVVSARAQLTRSAHVLRLASGLGEEPASVERWWFPVHLEIFERWGRWALRAEDAVAGERVSGVQMRALLDELMNTGTE